MKYELYGMIHRTAKKLLNRNNDLPDTVKLVSFPEEKLQGRVFMVKDGDFINEISLGENKIYQSQVYPIENLVSSKFDENYPVSFQKKKEKHKCATDLESARSVWPKFLEMSVIGDGYRNAGMHYAGYIQECQAWCLPSWVWTNAAVVRYYCSVGEIEKARKLGDFILKQQQPCGGWIVRNDYTRKGVSPQLAPNDSCYIALNCCLELYESTKEKKYLDAAVRNAKWTEETARPDGMVWFAFDTSKDEWVRDHNIVDTGFTAGLFARLYEITGEEHYLTFLKRFTAAYVKAFYMPKEKCFSTAIDGNDHQYGGAFGRGQGWALEGLIPAYRILKDVEIKRIIDECINTILSLQLKNGGWSYNLLKPMMGEDCKAVPVIARCLLDWYRTGNPDKRILKAVEMSLQWCAKHTVINGEEAGGIFSYTIEGAVVHHMYTSTAFVYGSSYALEVYNSLKKFKAER